MCMIFYSLTYHQLLFMYNRGFGKQSDRLAGHTDRHTAGSQTDGQVDGQAYWQTGMQMHSGILEGCKVDEQAYWQTGR